MRSIQTLNDSYPIDKNGEIVPPITTSNGSGIWDFNQKTTLQEILSMEITDADREREIAYQKRKAQLDEEYNS
jgi:hypothetical protein